MVFFVLKTLVQLNGRYTQQVSVSVIFWIQYMLLYVSSIIECKWYEKCDVVCGLMYTMSGKMKVSQYHKRIE